MKQHKKQILSLPDEVYEALNSISSHVGLTTDHLVCGVLSRFVNRSRACTRAAGDNRKFQRERLHLPAILSFWDMEQKVCFYKTSWIQDISLSGVLVCMDCKQRLFIDSEGRLPAPRFDLLFSLSGESEHIAYRCESLRITASEGSVSIAAEFLHSYNNSHLIMQKYLSQPACG